MLVQFWTTETVPTVSLGLTSPWWCLCGWVELSVVVLTVAAVTVVGFVVEEIGSLEVGGTFSISSKLSSSS